MRKIQIERKLFELFGYKFLVFENFQDADLNIDDQSIYKYDNQGTLVDTFATNQFYSIWNDERRLNAGVICALDSDISMVAALLKKIGLKDDSYSTYDCGLAASPPRVLFLTAPESMHTLISHCAATTLTNKLVQSTFFSAKENKTAPQRKSEITEA